MIKGVLVALGCASLCAACVGSAEDEGSAPASGRAAANQAAQVKDQAAAPVLEAPRVSRLVRGIVSEPIVRPEAQDWKPELRANVVETVSDEKGVFDPAAATAMRDLRAWGGVEK